METLTYSHCHYLKLAAEHDYPQLNATLFIYENSLVSDTLCTVIITHIEYLCSGKNIHGSKITPAGHDCKMLPPTESRLSLCSVLL